MGKPTVSRRLLVAGGLGVGGAVLVGVAEHQAHGPGKSSATRSATPSIDAPLSSSTTATASAPPTVSTPRTPAQLSAKLEAYQRSRGIRLGVALYDHRVNATFTHEGSWRTETFSIIKVLLLAAVLRRCQEQSLSLTPEQAGLARAMMAESDNKAADALLTWVGVAQVRRVARLFGLTSTVIREGTTEGSSNWWGYSTTTPTDQLKLLRGIWTTRILTAANRDYLKTPDDRSDSVATLGRVLPAAAIDRRVEHEERLGQSR
ncbi:serine hydrolase [Flexivirga alba]|uniref:Serine hydrolase n=1 Tax=Flexivirga alba TaxID=702742 RepID=A0ABW2ALE0_9MICO